MRKILHALFTLAFLFVFVDTKAQITIGTVDAGPYTPGSNIAATFTIGTATPCIKTTNIFNLYLVYPNGTEDQIGSFTGFYSTFVNGTIKATTPVGSGYKLRIKTTVPAITSTDSAPFDIVAGGIVTAGVTSFPSLGNTNEMFGYCTGINNTVFDFTNSSTSSSTVSGSIKNEVTGTNGAGLVFTSGTASFTAALANYTVLITAKLNGTVGTRAYMVINNNINNSFGTSGGNVVCLPGGFLQFPVDLTENGIKNNYPGTIYQINWGDSNGVPELFTFCDLKAGFVRHEYTTSSCGNPVYNSGSGPRYNVFGINISATNPICGSTIGGELSTFVKVVTKPENSFTNPIAGCTGSLVTFTNTSIAGQSEANSVNCIDNDVRYNWYVNEIRIRSNQTKAQGFQYTFPASGVYTIRMESVTSGQCNGTPVTHTICIQDSPQPIFDFGTVPTTGCAPFTIQAQDRSIIDNNCNTDNSYNWIVSPSAGVEFNPTDKNPIFKFNNPGTYSITLQIRTASCGIVSTQIPQKIILVDGFPTAALSEPAKLCALTTLKFDPTPNATQTIFTGTQLDLPDTYTWSVTESDGTPLLAGDYSFEGSTENTKYPSIKFNKYKTYKVSVIHKNTCGTATDFQLITFTEAPVPTIAFVKNPICYGANADLTGSISNTNYTSYTWSASPTGGSFINGNTLTPTYVPSSSDLAALTATITLTVNTGIPGDCAIVRDVKTITILPRNTGTSAATKVICTGTSTDYTPASTVAGSTFTWTATNADGNAQPGSFSPSGAGIINETIINTNPTANAVVVYTITPIGPTPENCSGESFTFTVTVTPRPIITANVSEKTICSNNSAAISVTSNISTTFTWTSTATNGVTGNPPSGSQTIAGTTLAINDLLVNTGINNGNIQGTVTYVITPYSSTGCKGDDITVIVHVDPAVTIADAGADENICSTSTYVLKGNALKPGETGLWTISPTPAHAVTPTFSDATAPGTTVNNLTPGENYVFIWTITGTTACGSTTDQVTINVNMPTIPGTTSTANPATVCQGINTGTITLTGNLGTILRWESSIDGGTTWVTAENTTNTATYTYTNITASTLYRAVVQNGQCTIENSTATAITVTPADTQANAGADLVLCNETIVTLQGNTNLRPGVETGMWTLVPATPSNPTVNIVDPTNPNTEVRGLVAGQTYTFKWTVTGPSACGPTSDDVVINNLRPIANNLISSTSAVVCSGQTITLTGTIPTGGNGTYAYTWENSVNGGTTWNIIAGQTDQNLTFNITVTTRFRRNISSATCPSVSNEYEITAQPPITNNIISADQTICTGVIPALLTGTPPQGADGNFNYQWQFSIDNGITWANVGSAVRPEYQPPALTTTTLYRRIVSTITCNGDQSSVSAAITIIVKPDAKADFIWTKDKDCAPFVINTSVITTREYPDRNDTYSWFANDVPIGTGATFPGYTITNSNESVTIKLVVTPNTGCKPDELSHVFSTNQAAAATYTQSATQGCGPLVVNFVNTSASLADATFRWNFGNGTTSSQAQPAAVTFLPEATGRDTTYTITLTATTTCGTSSITSTVFVKAKPISIFSPSKTEGCSPMKVTFTNTSPGGTNTYYYDFGDGTLLTKTDKSPVEHTYVVTATTDFTVKMIAENECGRNESSYIIRVSPQNITPLLVVNGNEKSGCAPLTVNFINNSIGASRFTFDFGDGGTANTITTGTVQHIYTRPGTYTVTMTAYNSCSEIAVTESITVLPQPLAAFDADVIIGCPGLPVQFRNTTQDGFSYLWDFGDGTTSDEFEPKHIYNGDQEYYTVTLTATNTLGCKISVIRNQFIHIVLPPVAKFNVNPSVLISIPNYTFRFEDESTNNPAVWAWDFGDGIKSTLQNPSHTYLDTGSYVVTLRVSNQQGCFTSTFKTVRIVGVPGYLYVPNSFMPGSETPELRVFMAKGSGIKSWTMSIFNKWGQTLWSTTKLDEGRPAEWWDGVFNSVPVPQGVYFWKIDVEFINGTEWKGMTYDSKAPKRTGIIHLIR